MAPYSYGCLNRYPGQLWELHARVDEGEHPAEQEGSVRAIHA